MSHYKNEVLDKICYTKRVYERINKKLKIQFSEPEIEKMIFDILSETRKEFFRKNGKNIYVTNSEKNIRITINSNTNRIITVDRI